MLEAIIKRLKHDKRGISNVIVVMLSLILIVVIVSNVVLWNYQMNQLDWEKMQENVEILDVARANRSSWFAAEKEYDINHGYRISGTYTDTHVIDNKFESFTEALAMLEYGCAFKSSNVTVSTSSATPTNDAEAALNINLGVDSHVLIIYNAGNRHGSTEYIWGKGCTINVDGEDKAFSWQSPRGSNYANSVTVVWAGLLTAGTHAIQGKFFSNRDGYMVTIDTRQLSVLWFPNIFAKYVRSTTAVTTTSATPVDDPEAVLTFNLDLESTVLIIYNVGNKRNSAEHLRGKGITINVDDNDIATRQWQSPYGTNHANSVTIAYVKTLAIGTHTIKGRFFANQGGATTTIDERQLVAFCFPTDLIAYGFTESTTSISTTSNTPENDTQAFVPMALTRDSDVFAMYIGGNTNGATESAYGKGLLLDVDGIEVSNSTSWQSPQAANRADSVSIIWHQEMNAGNYSFQGKFFSNSAGSTATISNRQLLVLAFPKPTPDSYRLDINGLFKIDTSTYPLDYVLGVEIQLIYRANDTSERWFLKVLNWTSSQYSDEGFNITTGHLPTSEWDYYSVNLTNKWRSYVHENGTMLIKFHDEGPDGNRTKIDVDFLGVVLFIDGARFTIQNKGPQTTHLIAIWMINATIHRRHTADFFVNPGESGVYIRADISLPREDFMVKIVTERGNMAVFISD
jgi:hypothetical protein